MRLTFWPLLVTLVATSTTTPAPPPSSTKCTTSFDPPKAPPLNSNSTNTTNATAPLVQSQVKAFYNFCHSAFFSTPNLFVNFTDTTLSTQCAAIKLNASVYCSNLTLEKNAEGRYTEIGFDIVCLTEENGENNVIVELSLNEFPFGELESYGLSWAQNFPNLTFLFLNDTSISVDYIANHTFPPLLQYLFCGQSQDRTVPQNLISFAFPVSPNGSLTTGSPKMRCYSLLFWSIQNQFLSGAFPLDVFNLPLLEQLDFTNNVFNSTLPSALSQLTRLVLLNLANNFFHGDFPDFEPMRNLLILDLSYNFFGFDYGTGQISQQKRGSPSPSNQPPEEQKSLSDMLSLPPDLQFFSVYNNYITGTFPNQLCTITALNYLSLGKNEFSGTLPLCIQDLVGLVSLDLSANYFAGAIPSWEASQWTQLASLSLYLNKLNGTIPTTFGAFPASTFQSLQLGHNDLHGEMPSQLGNLVSLMLLDLSASQIGGSIPATFTNMKSLTTLILDNTLLGGGSFNFPYQNNYILCALGNAAFYCPKDAPSICRCGRCYITDDPCGTTYDYCDPSAECVPNNNHWYTCECPNGPPINFYQCLGGGTVQNASLYFKIIFGIVGSAIAVLLPLLIFIIKSFSQSKARVLPKEVAWSFKLFENSLPFSWEYRGTQSAGYYFKELPSQSRTYKKAAALLSFFGSCSFKIDKITAVYNPLLLTNFSNAYLIQKARDFSKPYKTKTWKATVDEDISELVYQKYAALCSCYPWNAQTNTYIIPGLHGTSLSAAEKICETGFASLSLVDAGYFGKGIYFTSYPEYCSQYMISQKHPTILVSYLIPGRTYPVIEKASGPNSLLGTALKNGFNSHFVLTGRNGKCLEPPYQAHKEIFNEIVVRQEDQVVPAFIITIDETHLNTEVYDSSSTSSQPHPRQKRTFGNRNYERV